MIASRLHPRTTEALTALAVDAARGATSVVVQAGHFLLYYDIVEDRLLPCVAGELTSPRHELVRREAGEFPLLSLKLGLEVLAAIPARSRSLMIVVNDWQYLPKEIDRRRFYETFKRLPAGYEAALDRYRGKIDLLVPPKGAGTTPFFGEMNLRNQYRKNVERLMESRSLPESAIVEQGPGGVVCSLSDAVGRRREVYCSSKTGDCAGEIAQMLRSARELAACDCFINFYPAVCRDFVESGTEIGEDLLGNRIARVLNIGLPTSGVETAEDLLTACEVAWHRFPVAVGGVLPAARGRG